ncbi:8399_t:CDS:2, partial [Acaulospora morrowiae]
SVTDQQNNDDAKTSEEKDIDAFLREQEKKKVQDKMITKDTSSVTSDLTHCEEDLSMTSAELVTLPEQVVKELIPTCKDRVSKNSLKSKSGARFETGAIITEVDDGKINKAFFVQILELSSEVILMGSSEVTAQNIVDIFRLAMKLRRKEIICWYCYYKAYEDRVRDVKSKNGKPETNYPIYHLLSNVKKKDLFRGIDNYNFASPQSWSSQCPICDGNMGIMDYTAHDIKTKRNIVLFASLQAINSSSQL